jgi:hypothetical protein
MQQVMLAWVRFTTLNANLVEPFAIPYPYFCYSDCRATVSTVAR